MNILYKTFDFVIKETKEIDEDGQKYGIVKGYAATFGNVDRGGDMILPGAFTKTLQDYQARDRQLAMHYQHSGFDIIGGFPIETIKQDATGLYVEGKINLKVQRGVETYALAKQGVISDFSIGYTIDAEENQGDIRILKELTLWETSLVGEPMNTQAVITEVKKIIPAQESVSIDSKDKVIDEAVDESNAVKFEFPQIKTIRDIESVLKEKGFSNNQSKILIAKIKEFSVDGCDDCAEEKTDDRDAHSEGDELEIKTKLDDILKLLTGR